MEFDLVCLVNNLKFLPILFSGWGTGEKVDYSFEISTLLGGADLAHVLHVLHDWIGFDMIYSGVYMDDLLIIK